LRENGEQTKRKYIMDERRRKRKKGKSQKDI